MMAYWRRPRSSSCASKVPIQPRSLFSDSLVPSVFSITFHVTNNGVAASLSSFRTRLLDEKKLLLLLLLLVAELASLTPLGVEFVLWTLTVLLLAGEGAIRRETAAGRYGDPPAPWSWAVSSSGALGSGADESALYCFQSSSTCRKFSAVRFSRFADNVSKQ